MVVSTGVVAAQARSSVGQRGVCWLNAMFTPLNILQFPTRHFESTAENKPICRLNVDSNLSERVLSGQMLSEAWNYCLTQDYWHVDLRQNTLKCWFI